MRLHVRFHGRGLKKSKSLKLPNNQYFSIYMQIGENNAKLNCFFTHNE